MTDLLKLRPTYVLLVFVLCTLSTLNGQEPGNIDQESRISILFIGDIMGHDTQIASAENRETHTYDYNDVFKYIKPVLSDADVAIANLEVTLAGPPYKGYPQFSSPAALAVACSNAGIDYFALANNHSADRGRAGIISTINKLDSLQIPHTGSYLNKASRDSLSPLIIKAKGFSLALLNYTYGTNGIRVPKPVIVDSLDKEQVKKDILKAKKMNPDAVILFLHWGTEYDTVPAINQTALAEELITAGADLIIGSHPHVIQKMVWEKNPAGKDSFTVYSLGNFISNQRKPKTDGGSLVRIELVKKDGQVKIDNAGYFLTWVYTPIEDLRTRFYILPCSEFENKPSFFEKESDYDMMMKFIKESRNLLNSQNVNIEEFENSRMQLFDI
ncbi:MAG TPA: CapA family protein [Bacteroidales bacterium]|nr:CapA family protein [Bacteroidales bacterium]